MHLDWNEYQINCWWMECLAAKSELVMEDNPPHWWAVIHLLQILLRWHFQLAEYGDLLRLHILRGEIFMF